MKGIPYALLTLTAVFGFAVAWVLNQIWRLTFGAFFQWLGNLSLHVPIPAAPDIDIKPFHGLLKFDNDVQGFLSGMVAGSERAIVRLFHQTIAAFGGLAHELGALAQAIEHRVASLIGATIPRLIRHGVADLWALVRQVPGLVRRVEHLVGSVERKIKAGIASALAFAYRQLRHAGRYAQHIAASAWRRIDGLVHRVTRLERWVFGHDGQRWLRRALRAARLDWLFAANLQIGLTWVLSIDYGTWWEWVRDEVRIVLDQNMCVLVDFTYDLSVYVLDPVLRKTIALTLWICHPERGQLPHGCEYPTRYAGSWEPHGCPTEAELGFGLERLAPGEPLPRGVIKA